jgi:NADH-quinone oxidoreductase subunit N
LLAGALVVLALDLVVGSGRVARAAWAITLLSVIGAVVTGFRVASDEPVRILSVLTHDGFTVYMWRLILLALSLVVLLGESYVRAHTREPGLYYAFLLFFGLGALLLTAASYLVMVLLAVDFLSLVGYVLTGFLHYDSRSTEAAIKYLIYGSVLSAVMAYGLSWLYGLAGTADYAPIAEVLAGGEAAWAAGAPFSPLTLVPILVFVLAGFSFKIGSAPFHQWLPDAFEAGAVHDGSASCGHDFRGDVALATRRFFGNWRDVCGQSDRALAD